MKNENRTPVEALRKGLRILEILSGSDVSGGVSLAQMAEAMSLKRNTTHNLLKTLCLCGYAENVGAGRYALGAGVFGLLRPRVLVRDSQPALQEVLSELSRTIGEDVVFASLISGRRRALARAGGGAPVRVASFATDVEEKKLWRTVTGRILAAYCTAAERRDLLAYAGIPGRDWDGIEDVMELDRRLSELRIQGYAEQIEHGEVASLAVPVLDPGGILIGALGIHLPVYRFGEERHQDLLSALRGAGIRIAETAKAAVMRLVLQQEGGER